MMKIVTYLASDVELTYSQYFLRTRSRVWTRVGISTRSLKSLASGIHYTRRSRFAHMMIFTFVSGQTCCSLARSFLHATTQLLCVRCCSQTLCPRASSRTTVKSDIENDSDHDAEVSCSKCSCNMMLTLLVQRMLALTMVRPRLLVLQLRLHVFGTNQFRHR